MPMHLTAPPKVEFLDVGEGRTTVLLHCSASGAHQWQALVSELQDTRRIIAPNLLGYGRTDAMTPAERRSVAAQAAAVLSAIDRLNAPVDIVGHSFGAVIALEVAIQLADRAGRLVLFEPIQFSLLRRAGYEDELAEVEALHDHITAHAQQGDLLAVAARFTDFFAGEGVWSALPDDRRRQMADALVHNLDEWAAALSPALNAERWRALEAPVLLIGAADSRRPFRAIREILGGEYPAWAHHDLARGGHMAPVTRARQFNTAVMRFLSA